MPNKAAGVFGFLKDTMDGLAAADGGQSIKHIPTGPRRVVQAAGALGVAATVIPIGVAIAQSRKNGTRQVS